MLYICSLPSLIFVLSRQRTFIPYEQIKCFRHVESVAAKISGGAAPENF